MKNSMLFIIYKQFQIFNTIVRTITIDMVNNFSRFKITFNTFFHYQTMFSNITILISKWMFRHKNSNISIMSFSNSTFPKRMFFSQMGSAYFLFRFFRVFKILFAYFCTFFRTTIFSIPMRLTNLKLIATNNTFFNHFFLSKIKAAFRFLSETRLRISTLLTAYCGQKNTKFPIDINILADFNKLSIGDYVCGF